MIGHADQLPSHQGGLARAIAKHDGAHINMVMDPLESLRAAPISGHRERGIRGRGNVDTRRTYLKGSAWSAK